VYSNAPVGSPGSDGRRIDIIDLLTFQRVDEVQLSFPSRPHQSSLLSTDGVLVSTELDESVTLIDRRTRSVVARLPTGQAVTAGGSHLVVALRSASEIAVVDLRSGEVIHRIAMPNHPQAIVLHPDGVRAYSACDADNWVVEVDLRSGRLLRRIETGRKPDGIAWSPDPSSTSN
jgi:DNA-binding beta-propeller fold protein YncE